MQKREQQRTKHKRKARKGKKNKHPWISKAITVDLTRANSNDPRSQQIHQKKMLAECCSVHQIFAGNSLTITSEKHGVEIPAETGCKKFLPPWVACCIRAARYRLTITPGIKKTSVGGMLQCPSDFCRQQVDHHFWETRCGNSRRNLDVRNSCLLGWRIRAAKKTAWPSHLASKKKCWRNAAVSIRFLQATAWPSLLRKTVWKFLQKLGCKKFLPPWVECCIRAARYRLTITPGIKKKSVGGMLQCPSDFCRQQLDHHFWETQCGNSCRNVDVRNSCLLGRRVALEPQKKQLDHHTWHQKKKRVGGMLQCPSDFCRQQVDHHFWETPTFFELLFKTTKHSYRTPQHYCTRPGRQLHFIALSGVWRKWNAARPKTNGHSIEFWSFRD